MCAVDPRSTSIPNFPFLIVLLTILDDDPLKIFIELEDVFPQACSRNFLVYDTPLSNARVPRV